MLPFKRIIKGFFFFLRSTIYTAINQTVLSFRSLVAVLPVRLDLDRAQLLSVYYVRKCGL